MVHLSSWPNWVREKDTRFQGSGSSSSSGAARGASQAVQDNFQVIFSVYALLSSAIHASQALHPKRRAVLRWQVRRVRYSAGVDARALVTGHPRSDARQLIQNGLIVSQCANKDPVELRKYQSACQHRGLLETRSISNERLRCAIVSLGGHELDSMLALLPMHASLLLAQKA